MRVWLAAALSACLLSFAPAVAAHALSLQECFEGGDFIANAATGARQRHGQGGNSSTGWWATSASSRRFRRRCAGS